jgi:acyl-CoA synthetase (AMP-forming)/AMP-acid ligase II
LQGEIEDEKVMNVITEIIHQGEKHPHKMAISDIKSGQWTYEELLQYAGFIQQNIFNIHQDSKISYALVAATPSPELYASLMALMASGICIIFIEPWMEFHKINHVLHFIKPEIFLGDTLTLNLGKCISGVRKIPHRLNIKKFSKEKFPLGQLRVQDLTSTAPAFIVFTSGTTGKPKGIVRTHEYLLSIFHIFRKHEPLSLSTPDLAVFPNTVLYHLATGQGSLLFPRKLNEKNKKKFLTLFNQIKPTSVSAGPNFFIQLLKHNLLHILKDFKKIVCGGALFDIHLMETLVSHFPHTCIIHIYGGSEAEPVSILEAKEAITQSAQKNFFQVLCLGKPIPEIQWKIIDDILWVSGKNVAEEYIGDPKENLGVKMRDEKNTLWHCMGDRVEFDGTYFWSLGRSNQSKEEFLLEQNIYKLIGHSDAAIFNVNNEYVLTGNNVEHFSTDIRAKFPQVKKVINQAIIRDPRHEARIDRKRSHPMSQKNSLKKWITYLNERSPLPALAFISILITLSYVYGSGQWNINYFLVALVMHAAIFIQMRMSDEIKDYEKDCAVNPTRPLPRGLLTLQELTKAMYVTMGIQFGFALFLSLLDFWATSLLLVGTSVYAWLMYKEFFQSEFLKKKVWLYTLSHQLIVPLIWAWPATLYSNMQSNALFYPWLLLSLLSSLYFEVSRKLDPKAHPLAETYVQVYGKKNIVLCLVSLQALVLALALLMSTNILLIFVILNFCALAAYKVSSEKFKWVAVGSVLSSIITNGLFFFL